MSTVDFTEYDDAELAELIDRAEAEQHKRKELAVLDKQIADLAELYFDIKNVEEGSDWVQPVGPFDAYPVGFPVEHNGKTWFNLTPFNTHEPGVSGWREFAEDGVPADWVAPSGSHDAYMIADRVTFEGSVFESVIDANTWSPTGYPAGWKLID